MKIVGLVRGTIHFPDHPDHEGAAGLVGGEDVTAARETFRSIGEAMTWARRVLDGDLNPRWDAFGELLTPHTEPRWSSATVYAEHRWEELANYYTESHLRTWHKDENLRSKPARTDWPAAS